MAGKAVAAFAAFVGLVAGVPTAVQAATPAASATTFDVVGGTATWQGTSSRYTLPIIGPTQLQGDFFVGGGHYRGLVTLAAATLDMSTFVYGPAALSSADGTVSGLCTIDGAATVTPGLSVACTMQIAGHQVEPISFVLEGVQTSSSTYASETTSYDEGIFTSLVPSVGYPQPPPPPLLPALPSGPVGTGSMSIFSDVDANPGLFLEGTMPFYSAATEAYTRIACAGTSTSLSCSFLSEPLGLPVDIPVNFALQPALPEVSGVCQGASASDVAFNLTCTTINGPSVTFSLLATVLAPNVSLDTSGAYAAVQTNV